MKRLVLATVLLGCAALSSGSASAGPVEEIVCPATGSVVSPVVRALGRPDLVDVDEQGDTSVAGELVFDCPPFEG